MVNKRWSLKAYESLEAIFNFYKENPEYGRKTVTGVIEKIDQIKYPGAVPRRRNYRIALSSDHNNELSNNLQGSIPSRHRNTTDF